MKKGRAKVVINWEYGLHLRPATNIAKLSGKFSCEIKFIKGDNVCNARSVMGILTLEAQYGDNLYIETYGEDAIDALNELKKFFNEVDEGNDDITGLW